MNIRFKSAVALSLAASLTALADVKINDQLSFGGYVVGSYQMTDPDPGTSSDRFDLDAVKTVFTGSFKPVTGVVSLFYPGPSGSDMTVLDGYVTYDAGNGMSITGGKFLSYLGYEAFDPINMAQITYSPVTAGTLASIPAYHSGVRFDYSDKDWSFGAAILDSVLGPTIFKGDGELKENMGFEAYFKYTAVPNFVLWGGVAYDTDGNMSTPTSPSKSSMTVWDVWAEYKIGTATTLAAEFCVKNGGVGQRGDSWLVFWNQQFT
ncbi:MAG: outer membrane beta-barrel protein, partial [Opitutaceae bacterium]